MKFVFAENMDLVDPDYDFVKDRSSPEREPYWDDMYTHEMLGYAPYDGLLVSKGLFHDGNNGGKYSEGQEMRFKREGARKFLRFEEEKYPNTVMWGDCGAFAYANQEVPPFSVEEIIEFYADGQFTHGCSPDHIIFDFVDTEFDITFDDQEVKRRQQITLENAAEFIEKANKRIGNHFTPVGVIHGWTPKTMAEAAEKLIKMGYKYVALGGMVPLKADQIKSALNAVRSVIPKETEVHILGFAKADQVHEFIGNGLNSIDTTSPLLRAFKDSRTNYFTWTGENFEYFTAIRIPQVLLSNPLKKMVQSGQLELEKAVKLEKQAIKEVRAFDKGETTTKNTLEVLRDYWALINADKAKTNPTKVNKEIQVLTSRVEPTLKKQPWKYCKCKICQQAGVEVIIFRGNNRNRRRGMHNLSVYGDRVRELKGELR